MKTLNLFSWGYYGWGNATEQLIKAVDAVEKKRGFAPPILVDTRIRRAGRAPGFVGSAFEELLGSRRYVWMRTLGNKKVTSGTGKKIQIAKPEAVEELLDLALEASEQNRRLIFFCNCLWQKCKGKNACHRSAITDLTIAAARRRKLPVSVVEWPGDDRRTIRIELTDEWFRKVRNKAMFVPIPPKTDAVALHSLPWASIVTFTNGAEAIHRLVGPLIWRNDAWHIQILELLGDPGAPLSEYKELAEKAVFNLGLDAVQSR